MKFASVNVPVRMNCKNVGDHSTFHLMSAIWSNLHLSSTLVYEPSACKMNDIPSNSNSTLLKTKVDIVML